MKNIIIKVILLIMLLFGFVFAEEPGIPGIQGMDQLLPRTKSEEKGLDLANVVMKEGSDEGQPNLHSFLGCEFCHVAVPQKGFEKTEKSEKLEIITYNTESALCESCHVNECLHRSELDPLSVTPPIVVPSSLPLGNRSKSKGKIVCTTCHYIHGDTFLNQLIRGFQMNLKDATASYHARMEFCIVCHTKSEDGKVGNEKVQAIWTVHKKFKDNKHCDFCHKTNNADELNKIKEIPVKKDRDKKILESLKTGIKGMCSYCHIDQAGKQHFRAVNVFADKNLKENLEELGLPLLEGKFTCITCHEPHGLTEKTGHYLRGAYVYLAASSNRINPHRRKDFCLSCHLKYDDQGRITGLKFNGVISKVCTWCHDGKEARADVHPVGVVLKENEYMKKPQGLVLDKEDKLTCYSCHYTGYGVCESNSDDAARAENLKNVNHLRGWPYEDRWDQCYRCHAKREFKKFNAHYQLDSTTGKIIEESCIFCHSSRPEIDIIGIEKVKFKGIVIFICLGCHPDTPHPGRRGGVGANHLVKPTEVPGKLKIPDGIPRSDRQRLHCGSCHNPHAKGVISTLMGKGADANERKRFEKCTDCHISK